MGYPLYTTQLHAGVHALFKPGSKDHNSIRKHNYCNSKLFRKFGARNGTDYVFYTFPLHSLVSWGLCDSNAVAAAENATARLPPPSLLKRGYV